MGNTFYFKCKCSDGKRVYHYKSSLRKSDRKPIRIVQTNKRTYDNAKNRSKNIFNS